MEGKRAVHTLHRPLSTIEIKPEFFGDDADPTKGTKTKGKLKGTGKVLARARETVLSIAFLACSREKVFMMSYSRDKARPNDWTYSATSSTIKIRFFCISILYQFSCQMSKL